MKTKMNQKEMTIQYSPIIYYYEPNKMFNASSIEIPPFY